MAAKITKSLVRFITRCYDTLIPVELQDSAQGFIDYSIFYGYNNYVSDTIELEWDEAKCQQNLQEHGIDFKLARYVLADPNLVCRIDDRHDYKETRYIAYGMVEGQVFKLCYTMRGTVYRIISVHKIHKQRQEKYYGKNS